MRETPLFGPAGSPEDFHESGYKSALQMPGYLEKIGLNAFEYQCGRGVKISEDAAKKLGEKAKEHGISLSVHSPYYINIANGEPEKQDKSIDYIMQTLTAAYHMGADRIVVHGGAAMNRPRREGMEHSKKLLLRALHEADEAGFGNIHICPETMGKINQLGDLEETLSLCRLDERLLPTIDFGHLNARTLGGIKTEEDYAVILDRIRDLLGAERERIFHCHFSKIEYTKGGEKKHLTFEDDVYGPDFAPLAALMRKRKLCPTIICESAGTQGFDALAMKKMYEEG